MMLALLRRLLVRGSMHRRLGPVSQRATSVLVFVVPSIIVGVAAGTMVFWPQMYRRDNGKSVAVGESFRVGEIVAECRGCRVRQFSV
jgi:hypothetical protein